MRAPFYRPDYQKLLMSTLIEILGRTFVSKYTAETLKRSANQAQTIDPYFKTLDRAFETLRKN